MTDHQQRAEALRRAMFGSDNLQDVSDEEFEAHAVAAFDEVAREAQRQKIQREFSENLTIFDRPFTQYEDVGRWIEETTGCDDWSEGCKQVDSQLTRVEELEAEVHMTLCEWACATGDCDHDDVNDCVKAMAKAATRAERDAEAFREKWSEACAVLNDEGETVFAERDAYRNRWEAAGQKADWLAADYETTFAGGKMADTLRDIAREHPLPGETR